MSDAQEAATRPSTGSRGAAPWFFDGGKVYITDTAKVLSFFFLTMCVLFLIFDPLLRPSDRKEEYNQHKRYNWSSPNCGQLPEQSGPVASFPWNLTVTDQSGNFTCGASLLTGTVAATSAECCSRLASGGQVNGVDIEPCKGGSEGLALLNLKSKMDVTPVCLHSPRFEFRWGTLQFQGYAKWIPDIKCGTQPPRGTLDPGFTFCGKKCLMTGSGLYSKQLDQGDRFYLVGVVKECGQYLNMTSIRLNSDKTTFIDEFIKGAQEVTPNPTANATEQTTDMGSTQDDNQQ